MAGKKIFSWLETTIITLLVGGVCVGTYFYSPTVRSAVHDVTRYYAKMFGLEKPCVEPILYKIGNIDPRFGITRAKLVEDIEIAGSMWSNEIGHPLFKESPEGDLTISLLFDNRQATTLDLKKIGSVIDKKRADYAVAKSQYTALQDSYTQQKKELDAQIADFKQANASYEEEVRYWNRHGGASPSEASKLDAERAELTAKAKEINAKQTTLNALVDKINATTAEINALAKDLNGDVAEYNTTGASTGKEFNEGEYIQDSTGERIIVYQFDNNAKLVRVLEHELGHALGMSHVSNTKSIMYYLNEGSNEKLTAEDVAELKSVCRLTL